MNLRSAARGFLAFLLLLSAPALQGENDWTVTYTSRNVCALRGSTVNISCSYEYPDNIEQRSSTVLKTRWFTKPDRNQQIDIRSATDYKGRVKYSCGDKNCTASRCSGACTLTIKDLRQSDSNEYQVRLIKQPDWGYTGNPGVKLTVTDLQAFIHSDKPTLLDLECQSICGLAKPTYKWFRNGENAGRGKFYRGIVNSEDSYACAVEGFERFHSPSVYAPKTPSVTVSPSGEIEEGSSVTLSCSSDANPAAKYIWFKEHEDSVKESGQNYTITNITSELGGHYYCQAHNAIGRHNSTWLSVNVTEASSSSLATAVAARTFVVSLVAILLLVFLWMGLRASRRASGLGEAAETVGEVEEESLPVPVYENISALTNSSAPSAQREPIQLLDLLPPMRSDTAGPVLCGQL